MRAFPETRVERVRTRRRSVEYTVRRGSVVRKLSLYNLPRIRAAIVTTRGNVLLAVAFSTDDPLRKRVHRRFLTTFTARDGSGGDRFARSLLKPDVVSKLPSPLNGYDTDWKNSKLFLRSLPQGRSKQVVFRAPRGRSQIVNELPRAARERSHLGAWLAVRDVPSKSVS